MIDWNNDGKIDHKDDAFFYNVVVKDSEKESNAKSGNSSSKSSNTSSSWVGWVVLLCIAYLFIKIIGD